MTQVTLCRRVLALAAVFAVATTLAQAGQAKVDVSGTWMFDVQTDAGAGSPTMTFKQDGEKLTGHYTGTFGEADLTGTVKGNDITFSFTVDAQGNSLKETYTGTVDKDTMKGKLV